MRMPFALLTVIVIWLAFIAMTVMGFVLSLVAAPLGKLFGIAKWVRYAEHNLHALDCAAAAAWGWDGRKTISRQCAESDGYLCRATCWALSIVLEDGHCDKQLR